MTGVLKGSATAMHAVFRHAVEFGLRTVVFFRIMQKLLGRGGESKPLRFARVILFRLTNFYRSTYDKSSKRARLYRPKEQI